MRCIRPLKAGFDQEGNIVYSIKKHDRSQVGLQFECRKCLPCRLNIAREKAVRAYHESKMHEDSIFLTLTYDDDHLESPRLVYKHFQDFIKRLRWEISVNDLYANCARKNGISIMVTGEYGDKTKRPHWHALIFGYRPHDAKHHKTTELGHKVYGSEELTKLWGHGFIEFGEVTIESAGYVARYAAKKLTHGNDGDHDFHPIHKTSNKRAIGRLWIEKYYEQTFKLGYINLPNGSKTKIPRYYIDWCKKHKPELYEYYVTHTLPQIVEQSQRKIRQEEIEYFKAISQSIDLHFPNPLPRAKVKETILKSKFKQLQERLKL